MEFFPEIEPYNTFKMRVSELHTLYVEEVGNPDGRPVVFLHGGPGGGISQMHRRFFDPKAYRIVLFDQRGSGKSTPLAELKENTTWDLVNDIEKIRQHLGIQKWIVFGGSWGSTLALTYATHHSSAVEALILRGIFLCRPSEIKWFYQEGASNIFPDYWETFLGHIPEEERGDLVAAYYKRLTHPDGAIQLSAAKIWSQWEAATSYLYVNQDLIDDFENPDLAISFARIESHYFINNAFFPTDNYILENVNKIRHLPTIIVQGRYDVVCPSKSAWDLHRAFPEAELYIIPNAGHAAGEVGIRSALLRATEKFKNL